MDSRQLRAFIAVADHGGISAAAGSLGYAQSSVSDQIKGLERDLGVTVLSRTSTGAILTDAGRQLLPQARELLALDEQIRRSVAGLRPTLRIGALETLAGQWLPGVLAAFEQGAAGSGDAAQVTLSVATRRRLAEDLAAGRLDAVFVYGSPLDRHPGPRAVVGHDQAVLVAAPDHPLAGSGRVSVAALRRAEFLIAEAGCTSEMLHTWCGRDLGAGNRIATVTGSLAALLRLTEQGRGIALLPHLAAVRHLESGDLVRLDLPEARAAVTIEAQWRPGAGSAQRPLQALLRLARRHQPAHPAPHGAPRPARSTGLAA